MFLETPDCTRTDSAPATRQALGPQPLHSPPRGSHRNTVALLRGTPSSQPAGRGQISACPRGEGGLQGLSREHTGPTNQIYLLFFPFNFTRTH